MEHHESKRTRREAARARRMKAYSGRNQQMAIVCTDATGNNKEVPAFFPSFAVIASQSNSSTSTESDGTAITDQAVLFDSPLEVEAYLRLVGAAKGDKMSLAVQIFYEPVRRAVDIPVDHQEEV